MTITSATLQNLRLLPPPCNELVPLLTTIAIFSIASSVVDLQHRWKEGPMKAWSHEEDLFVYGSFVVYMTMYWVYSMLIHTMEHSFQNVLLPFKIQPKEPIASWNDVFVKMTPLVFINQIFFAIPMLKGLLIVLKWRKNVGTAMDDLDFLVAVPTIPRFVGMFVIHILCTEIWFYFVHRLLHTRWLYKHIHSIHHSYKAPSCLESVYVHPIEFVLNSFGNFLIGPLVTAPPIIVMWMWLAMCTFLQVHDHSGYWFPFLPKVLMHDYHHQRVVCCYGILGLMDNIFHTDDGFGKYVDKMEASTPCRRQSKVSKDA